MTIPRPRAATRSWFAIRAQAESDEVEVLIYDYIGWGGVEAAEFTKQLQAITAKAITVKINSPGGDVFDGLAIYNTLKAHAAAITTKIDGIAASAASIIAMAGQRIVMGGGAFLMLHNPWALAIGNANEMREMAAVLDKIGDSLAGIYADRAKSTKEQARAWMDAESWFSAQDAKAAGLADEIVSGTASASAAFDLSGYSHPPEALRPSPHTQTEDQDATRRAAIMRRRLSLVERGEQSR